MPTRSTYEYAYVRLVPRVEIGDPIELIGKWPEREIERVGREQVLERRLQQVGEAILEFHDVARRANPRGRSGGRRHA